MVSRLIPFDPSHERRRQTAPQQWTVAWVLMRVVEVYAVERRLPSERKGNGAAWLFPNKHEFSEIVSWDDARQRVWDAWARAAGVWPYELSRAEEAAEWLSTVLVDYPGERRCLALWAKCRAYGQNTSELCRQRGWARATFHRKVNAGAARIAAILNSRRVAVR